MAYASSSQDIEAAFFMKKKKVWVKLFYLAGVVCVYNAQGETQPQFIQPLKTPGTEIGVTAKKPLDIVIKQNKTKFVLTSPGQPELVNTWITRLMNSKDGVPTPEQRKEQNIRKKLDFEKRASMSNLSPINLPPDPTGPAPARPPSGSIAVSGPRVPGQALPGRPDNGPATPGPTPPRPSGSLPQELLELTGAAWNDDLETLNKCLTQPNIKEFLNKPNARGQSALYCASRQGHINSVLALLKTPGINPNIQVPEHGGTPLHAAGYGEHGAVVALLLKGGADPDNVKNRMGLSAKQEAKGAAQEVYSILAKSGMEGVEAKYPIIKQLADKKFLIYFDKACDQKKIVAYTPAATVSSVLQKVSQQRGIVFEDHKAFLKTGQPVEGDLTLGDLFEKFGTQEVCFLPIPRVDARFTVYFDKGLTQKKITAYKEEETLENVLKTVCETRGIVYADYKASLVGGVELDPSITLGEIYSQYATQEICFLPIPKASIKFVIYFDKTMERKKVVPYKESERLEDVLQKLAQLRGISYEDQRTTLPDGSELEVSKYTLGDIYAQFGVQEVFFVEIPRSADQQGSELATAAWNGDLARVKSLCASPNIINFVNATNDKGQSALFCAARQGHADIVLELLKTPGVNVNFQVAQHGGTPLHAAGYWGHAEVVAMLLYAGADYNIQNNDKLIPKLETRGDAMECYHIIESVPKGVATLINKFPSLSALPVPAPPVPKREAPQSPEPSSAKNKAASLVMAKVAAGKMKGAISKSSLVGSGGDSDKHEAPSRPTASVSVPVPGSRPSEPPKGSSTTPPTPAKPSVGPPGTQVPTQNTPPSQNTPPQPNPLHAQFHHTPPQQQFIQKPPEPEAELEPEPEPEPEPEIIVPVKKTRAELLGYEPLENGLDLRRRIAAMFNAYEKALEDNEGVDEQFKESRKPKGFSLSDMTLVYYPSNPDEFDYLEGWKIDKVPDDPYYIESIEDLFHADEGDETFVLDANDVSALIVRYSAAEHRWYLLQSSEDEVNIFFKTADLLLTMFPWNPVYTLVKDQGLPRRLFVKAEREIRPKIPNVPEEQDRVRLVEKLFFAISEVVLHMNRHYAQLPPLHALEEIRAFTNNNVIGPVVYDKLVPALHNLFSDGFDEWTLFGTHYIWDYISACASEKAVTDHVQLFFNKVIAKINGNAAIQDRPELKFQAFVCAGLSNNQFASWLKLLAGNKQQTQRFFKEHALWRIGTSHIIELCALLDGIPFTLSGVRPSTEEATFAQASLLEQFANETAAQARVKIDDQLKEFGVEGGLEEVNQKVEEIEQAVYETINQYVDIEKTKASWSLGLEGATNSIYEWFMDDSAFF